MSRTPINEAARAHSNLNTFASIVTILEGGHIYGLEKSQTAQKTAQKIIDICKREQQFQLRAYDAAVHAANKETSQ
ncbi:hypothetical protein ACELLULO517_07480 [Acidisoma cellulosilytica]|uniref:Uncharacterized protein n=1 Tax=Acidisoma cellulosilyticum TaxID=2802395 RepID=A0A963YZR2_9PROT|nr:hypothetical protein [Acidisoma cellulosilyticum]MCB8880071.1 hypothetical protein [Acidisoma cellulosilyticum]